MLMRASFAFALLASAGCSQSKVDPNQPQILAGKYVDALLKQCSRSTPPQGEGTWMPEHRVIGELEAKLRTELPGQLQKSGWVSEEEVAQFPLFPSGFRRQYVGIVRAGRRYIYGNFSPKGAFEDFAAAGDGLPFIVCDGGPNFFGAEYDVEARRFTHWGFNGVA
jgi:hypothetical protein